MEQNTKPQGITLAEILKMFRGKVILVVCLTLVAAIIGGAFAVISSMIFGDYGAEVEFYVSPIDDSYTLLPLLQSESFTEKLLLEENGLPKKELCDAADYAAALAAIEATNAAREAKYEASKRLERIPYELAPIQEKYNHLKSVYSEIEGQLEIYKSTVILPEGTPSATQSANHAAMIEKYEKDLENAKVARDDYYDNFYAPKISEKHNAEAALDEAIENLTLRRAEEAELVEKVLAAWRKQSGVKEQLAKIRDSVSFKYATREVATGATTTTVENNSFLLVSVSVPNDEEFANGLLGKIKEITPEYVEKNIEKLTGKVEVECSLMSTFSGVGNLNSSGLIKNIVLYALILGIAMFALLCLIIIGGNFLKPIFGKKNNAKEEAEEKELANV